MQKTIESLYYGMHPSENLMPKHENYFKETKEANLAEEKLCEELTKEERKTYDEVMSKRTSTFSCETTQAFVDGFKIGANFLIEVLCD